MKLGVRAVAAFLLISLAGCQTVAQQRLTTMKTDMSSTNAAVKACNLAVSSKSEYSELFNHAPKVGRPSLTQFADQTKVTDAERTHFIAMQADFEPCRQIRLEGLSKTDRRAGDILSTSYAENDRIRVNFIQRKLSWGEYLTKTIEIGNRMHSDLQAAEGDAISNLNAQHQQELARIIHEKCAIKAKPLLSLTTMRMGCLMKFFAMKSLAQVFGGLGRFRAVR